MARSAAALVGGFETFDPALDLAGVLFNRVGGPGHAELLREAVQAYCRATPLGGLPSHEKFALPERHLGLVMARESLTAQRLAEMADWIESSIDVESLLKLARERSPHLTISAAQLAAPPDGARPRIGVASDAAFCFYYQDNLDLLAECGAELVEFSPIADRDLPADLNGLYLGGGYPEIHAELLSNNRRMRDAVRKFAESGAPVYAECGGFMYLTAAIVDTAGREYPMTGVFPTRARMQERLAALAYIEAEGVEGGLWLRAGERLRGHEFRYSNIDEMAPSIARRLRVFQKSGTREEGYAAGSVLAGYIHLHFRSAPAFARRFVGACSDYRTKLQPHAELNS
jgi:cobyrinic acid a,c-diamide synthase